jgi:GNAT superfamily N-acetyltransferase
MAEQIRVATTDDDYAAFGAFIREYGAWLTARYADVPGLIDSIGSHQGWEDEIRALPAKYGPPEGKTLLASRDGEVSGVVAYRDLHDGSCEMKRLFVPERFQGRGTGRLLCEALVVEATTDGYALMRLDTGFLNSEAMAMYASLGFTECPAYLEYPVEVAPHLRFMELPLA